MAPQPVWQAGEPMIINIDFDGLLLLGGVIANLLVVLCASPDQWGTG